MIIIIYIQYMYMCIINLHMMQPPRSPPKGYGYIGIGLWVYRSYVPRPPLWVGGSVVIYIYMYFIYISIYIHM